MGGVSAVHVLVIGRGLRSAAIPALDINNTGQLLEGKFRTPETAARKDRHFVLRGIVVIVRLRIRSVPSRRGKLRFLFACGHGSPRGSRTRSIGRVLIVRSAQRQLPAESNCHCQNSWEDSSHDIHRFYALQKEGSVNQRVDSTRETLSLGPIAVNFFGERVR